MRSVLLSSLSFLVSFGLARWAFAPGGAAPVKAPVSAPAQQSPVEPEVLRPAAAMRQRWSEALAGDDPLASAARAVAWIEAMTADDFRELGEAPANFPRPYFLAFQNEFRAAFPDALARRWLELDPERALAAMQRLQAEWTKAIDFDSGELLQGAARARPELVLEKLPLENEQGYLTLHARTALQTLGARDARSARRFLERFTEPKQRHEAEAAIGAGVAESDPLAGVALARQLNDTGVYYATLRAAERIGPGMVRQVVAAAGSKLEGSPDLFRLLLRYPDLAADFPASGKYQAGGHISDEVQRAADHTPPDERARVLASYETLPAGVRDNLAAALASSWARTEPREAAEWALAHAQPADGASSANQAADQVFLRWVNIDADAAINWWRSLPASPLRDALGNNASTFIAEDGRLDAALALFRPRAGDADALVATQLAQFLAARAPAEAAAWLAALPAETATNEAARVVIDEWYPREPEAVARWVEALPPGARREDALQGFIRKAAVQSPTAAAEWVETVRDPKLRQDAAMSVYWQWRAEDPAAAQKWIRRVSSTDPELYVHHYRLR